MLMGGSFIYTERTSPGGLDTYCRLEGFDQMYLAAEKNKMSGTKPADDGRKIFSIHK